MSKTGSAIFGSGQLLPIFTGAHELVGDYEKGYMILKTSGTLTLFPRTFDFFLVGGGGRAAIRNQQVTTLRELKMAVAA